jgi:nitroreductase
MDIIDAINNRRSIRGYKPDPVPREVLEKILEAACKAPSAMNTQPWEFFVLGGEVLKIIREEIVAKLNMGEPIVPEHNVTGWPKESVFRDRQVGLAKGLFKLMDIQREDVEKRAAWMERGFRFFDAPAAIIIGNDRALTDTGPLLDLGAAMQNICLAALTFGLGTCIEDQGVLYPKVIREHVGIPDSKRIVISIALGYPDPDFPANQLKSEREAFQNVTKWAGF